MDLDRTFILDATDRNMEIVRFDNGDIGLHCGTYVSSNDAQQLCNALMALLSGAFDRATTEYCLSFDLSRRRPQSGSAPDASRGTPQPELDTL